MFPSAIDILLCKGASMIVEKMIWNAEMLICNVEMLRWNAEMLRCDNDVPKRGNST